MPPFAALTKPTIASTPLTLLNVLGGLYRATNFVLLTILGLGALVWLLDVVRRRPRSAVGTRATSASGLFLLSTLIGMGTLSVFDVGQGPDFIGYLYWTDFMTPAELFVVFGAIAGWTYLAKRFAGPRSTRDVAIVDAGHSDKVPVAVTREATFTGL
jgi:hypothetical protein